MTTNEPHALGETNRSESPEGQSGWPRGQSIPGYSHMRREPHILIVSGDEALAGALISILDDSGFAAEHANTMADGCALAESGHFQVVLTEPSLTDGSWRRLKNLAGPNHPQLAVVLVAKSRDPHQWVRALEDGAFDVIDARNDLPKAAEVVTGALWVEYLNGVGPVPDLLRSKTR